MGYGNNYKYEGILAVSTFVWEILCGNKVYVTIYWRFELSKLNYDNTCAYLNNKNIHNNDTKKYLLDLVMSCKKIEPFVIYYKRLIISYNNTAHSILENEIDLILPQVPRKHYHHISIQLHRVSLWRHFQFPTPQMQQRTA